jgi:hypothetical protein
MKKLKAKGKSKKEKVRKIPISKHQITNKSQIPMTQTKNLTAAASFLCFGHWFIGAWCL